MAKGLSIHLGVNYVNSQHYGGRFLLPYCVNDAIKMDEIAEKNGFESYLLLNEEATSANLFYLLDLFSASLEEDDLLFLSFSGHGSYLKDINGDEMSDEWDEAILLYDRMIVDDQLALQWTKFKAGVRVLVIADSCHCGTIIKDPRPLSSARFSALSYTAHKQVITDIYLKNKKTYDAVLKNIPSRIHTSIDCSVLLLAACQDDQVAGAGLQGGKELSTFTEVLAECWNDGRFEGSYYTLHELIAETMTARNIPQKPNYFLSGVPNKSFEYQRPFTI